MARAFWKGSISFGLVEIPVTLRPALENHDISFTLLNRKDFAPVGYKRYDKNTGREVPWDEIVRGYEYEPDEYVVLSDEELKAANAKATQTVEIVEFVEGEEIDPIFFDTPYYVEPQKKGSKSYALLREALKKSGKVGIAKVVLRTRQHLAALLVRKDVLVLNLLRYAHEIRSLEELDVPAASDAEVAPREVHMAEQLIEGMTAAWKPDQFQDEYRDDVLALVQKKIKANQTHTIVEPEKGAAPARAREVVDLMPLLKESLEQQRGGRAGPARASAEKRRSGGSASRPSSRSGSSSASRASHARSSSAPAGSSGAGKSRRARRSA